MQLVPQVQITLVLKKIGVKYYTVAFHVSLVQGPSHVPLEYGVKICIDQPRNADIYCILSRKK